MSKVRLDLKRIFGPRWTPHRVIIAKGDDIRTFTIRPWLVIGLASVALAFGGLYLAATAYLIYRDDLFAASLVRQARLRHAYEDRIAELRAQIDRVTSRQVVNQEILDSKMEALLGRQATLDARQAALAGLGVLAKRAGIDLSSAAPQTGQAASEQGSKPLTTGSIAPAGKAQFALNDLGLRLSTLEVEDKPQTQTGDMRLAKVESSIEEIERQQLALVGAVAESATQTSRQIAGVLGRLGLDIDTTDEAVGGPFIPVSAAGAEDEFTTAVVEAAQQVQRLGQLRHRARNLPLWRPISSAAVTSRYGVRMDPFLKRPALHSGIDFRAGFGQAIRATAAGTVIEAGANGGYGNMVEIDHGGGITTRYGHMSRIQVKVGQKVTSGTVVGQVGSTGRSTGPHLHYEVRIDGEAIDPGRFIRAGGDLRGLL